MSYFFSVLFYIGLIILSFQLENKRDDTGLGGMLLALTGFGWAISSLILTISMNRKGSFDWVSNQEMTRNLLVGIGWVVIVSAIYFSAAFKIYWSEGEILPQFLRWISLHYATIWLPLLVLVPCLVLMNGEMPVRDFPNLFKIPFLLGFAVSGIFCLGMLYGAVLASYFPQKRHSESPQERNNRIHDTNLSIINSFEPDYLIEVLVDFTSPSYAEDVRAAAAAKIKSFPNGEAKLVEIIDGCLSKTAEVYTYIDDYKVGHPELFIEAHNRYILHIADKIHKQIKEDSPLWEGQFEDLNIDCLLKVTDEQFSNKGMDFHPAVLKLQAALNTTRPERYKDLRLNVTAVVDNWLEKHKK